MSDPTHRPRITLVVFAYNQSAMIDAAIDSALVQVCEPIEILLSDDASPDDTFARMQARAATLRAIQVRCASRCLIRPAPIVIVTPQI